MCMLQAALVINIGNMCFSCLWPRVRVALTLCSVILSGDTEERTLSTRKPLQLQLPTASTCSKDRYSFALSTWKTRLFSPCNMVYYHSMKPTIVILALAIILLAGIANHGCKLAEAAPCYGYSYVSNWWYSRRG